MRVREWNDRGGSPGLRPGIFSTSSCCLMVWYSLRLAGTVGKMTRSGRDGLNKGQSYGIEKMNWNGKGKQKGNRKLAKN